MKSIILLILFFIVGCLPTQISAQDTLFYRDIELTSLKAYSRKGDFMRTSDGGILVNVYHNDTTGGYKRVSLLKLDSDGDLIWQKDIPHLRGSTGLAEDSLGNYLVANIDTLLKAIIIKIDPLGNVLWSSAAPTTSNASTVLTTKTHYYLFGDKPGAPSWENDFFVAKFDYDHNLIWSKVYDTGDNDIFQEAILTSSGKLLISGRSHDAMYTYYTVHLFMIDVDGAIEWSNKYTFGDETEIKGMTENADGDFALTGRSQYPAWRILYLETNNVGVTQYFSEYHVATYQEGYSIHPLDAGYMICIEPEAYFDAEYNQTGLLKIKEDGEVEKVTMYTISDEGSFPFKAVQEDNGFLILGIRNDNDQLWLAKTDVNGYLECLSQEVEIGTDQSLKPDAPQVLYQFGSLNFSPVNMITLDLNLNTVLQCTEIVNPPGQSPEPEPEPYLPFVPNVFSPDGDGINDLLTVVYTIPDDYLFTITNRWGEIVFESSSPDFSWNGKIFNTEEAATAGVYFYVITTGNLSGYGTVTLIR